jgi:hypothetical protein
MEGARDWTLEFTIGALVVAGTVGYWWFNRRQIKVLQPNYFEEAFGFKVLLLWPRFIYVGKP